MLLLEIKNSVERDNVKVLNVVAREIKPTVLQVKSFVDITSQIRQFQNVWVLKIQIKKFDNLTMHSVTIHYVCCKLRFSRSTLTITPIYGREYTIIYAL